MSYDLNQHIYSHVAICCQQTPATKWPTAVSVL